MYNIFNDFSVETDTCPFKESFQIVRLIVACRRALLITFLRGAVDINLVISLLLRSTPEPSC